MEKLSAAWAKVVAAWKKVPGKNYVIVALVAFVAGALIF